MPDLSAPLGAVLDILGPPTRVALVALLRTSFGMAIVVAGGCWLATFLAYSHGQSPLRALFALAATFALGGVLTGFLALKRAVGRAVLVGLARLKVGQRLTGLVFDRLLGVDAAEVAGQRGGRVARFAERVPLTQAEQRLSQAVESVLGQAQAAGFLRRRIIASLLNHIATLTLRAFRDGDQEHAGVDLAKVRYALEPRIDEVLVQVIEGTLLRLTASVAIGFLLVSLLVGLVLQWTA